MWNITLKLNNNHLTKAEWQDEKVNYKEDLGTPIETRVVKKIYTREELDQFPPDQFFNLMKAKEEIEPLRQQALAVLERKNHTKKFRNMQIQFKKGLQDFQNNVDVQVGDLQKDEDEVIRVRANSAKERLEKKRARRRRTQLG